MEVEVVNYKNGAVKVIEIDKNNKPFVYKDAYLASLSDQKAIYGWDECKKSSQKKKALSF